MFKAKAECINRMIFLRAALTKLALGVLSFCTLYGQANASDTSLYLGENFKNSPFIKVKHEAQGTGNYKGKRDRHEKPMPQNEKKKKSSNWFNLKR